MTRYGDGLTAAYTTHDRNDDLYGGTETSPRDAPLSHRDQDPFKPPAPVPRSVSRHSDQFDLASRPATKVSRADSYAYGSIYDGYSGANSQSRPESRLELDPTTPATSTLLPWMTQPRDAPPVPTIPPVAKAPSGLRNQYEIAQDVRRPAPPAAVMAQTPAMQGGWSGTIPPFR